MGESDQAPELRLADVETFLAVVRLKSVSGAARNLKVTPSQVSKAIVRLERHLGRPVMARGARGVELSDYGRSIEAPMVDLLSRARALREPGPSTEITLVSATYLTDFFLPHIVAGVGEAQVHSIETAPGLASAFASLPLFDAVLTTREERWPDSWSAVRIGQLRKALYASPRTASRLGPRVTPARLASEIFIGPIYAEGGQAVPGDDDCPLPARARHFGHRTQTVSSALQLARHASQLVFAPEIAARSFVQQGWLVEIPVEGWNVREPLSFVCHQERVRARQQRAIILALQAALRKA